MRPRHWIHAGSVLLAGMASAPAARADSFDLTVQDRHVDVAIAVSQYLCSPPPLGCTPTGSPTNYADSESAPGFAPFAATASVAGFGGFSATQDSTLSAETIAAQGSGVHTGSGAFTPPPPNLATTITGSSDSHFEVSFDVDAPTAIRLTGSVAATGGLSANSTAHIRLRTAGGATLAEVVAATDPYCQEEGCFTVGPFPIEHEAVLAAGSYVLEAATAGDGAPFYFAGNIIPIASTGAYQLTLTNVAVPALSRGAQALLALGLAAGPLLARRRRT